MVMVAEAAEKRGLRKKRTSSMGLVTWVSQKTKRHRKTMPSPKAVTTAGSPQPTSGASMMPKSSVASMIMDSTAPTGSSLPSSGSRELGTKKKPRITAAMQIG